MSKLSQLDHHTSLRRHYDLKCVYHPASDPKLALLMYAQIQIMAILSRKKVEMSITPTV